MAIDTPAVDTTDDVLIRLLGGFRASVAGAEVAGGAWPSRRAAELVQLLALSDRHRLLREQVVEALWPRLDPQAGGANLRKAAHHARRAMGRDDAVVLRGGQVLLFPDAPLHTDVARFQREAAAALAAGDAERCTAAAAAYAGELLPESRYEPWTEAARTRLRATYLRLLRAGGQLERLAREEPTDEAAHRALMRTAIDAGSRPAAIRWYGRLRTALARGFGVSPSPETRRLYDECIAGLDVTGPGFLGRPLELASAGAVLRAADGERPGALVVRGPAGIGKSAFCREIAGLARAAGWSVTAVDGIEAGRPYGAVTSVVEQQVLDDRSVLEGVSEHARSVLASLSPLAGPTPPLAIPLGRHQVIGALRRLLLAAARGRPALLAVDDAHGIDEASAEVLAHLAASPGPVLVVLAVRSGVGHPTLERGLARLAHSGRLAGIELGPLEHDEAAMLVTKAAARVLDAATVERIVSLADGNPFAALELARVADPDASRPLPASTREAITQRLCEVDEATRTLLGRLALADDTLDTARVVALTGGDETDAFALLDRALAANVLVVSGTGYRFRHDLVRRALVEQVPPHHAAALHREIATALAAIAAPAALVARHWLAGERPREAAPWLLEAARAAHRLGAYADTLRHVEPLLAWDGGQADALRLKAEALDAMGDLRALAAYDAAVAAADARVPVTDAPTGDDLRAKRALAQVKMGDATGALVTLQGIHPTSVDGRLSEALAYSGAAALGLADPAMGTLKAAECRRLALASGDEGALVIASWAHAAAAHARGELHGSVWADLRETQHLPHLAVRVFDGHLCITQRFLYGARPYADVIAFADALAAESRRLGAGRGHAFAVTLRGEARMLAGDLEGAETDLTEGGRLHRAIGGATGEALSLQRRAEMSLYRGRHADAVHMLDDALDIARQSDVGFHLLDRIYGTRIAIARAPDAGLAALEDAEDAVRGPLETCPGCRITFAVPAAIAAARARELDLAARHERSADYLANVVMRLPAWNAALHETRAHIALAAGDRPTAAARFAAAAEGFRGAQQPLDQARCREQATRIG